MPVRTHSPDFSALYRRLWKTALLTAPVISLANLAAPMIFVFSLGDLDVELPRTWTTPRFLLSWLIICTNVLVLWGINVGLLWQQQRREYADRRADYLRYALAFGFAFLQIYLVSQFHPNAKPLAALPSIRWYPFLGFFSTNTIILIVLELVVSKDRNARLELRRAQLEIGQLLSEQAQLKQQIQPHFLFNALHTLQILVETDPAAAKQYTGRLARFLRTSLDITRRDTHPVADELAFLEQYVWLQRVRFGDQLSYTVDLPDAALTAHVPVCCFQIFMENVIKHNAVGADQPMMVRLSYHSPHTIRFANPLAPRTHDTTGTRTGLDNLARRYRTLGSAELAVCREADHFIVDLPLLNA